MKKIFNILCCVALLTVFMTPPKIKAQTLGDLKKELEAQQSELSKNEEEKTLTQSQINATESEIRTVENTIAQTYKDIDTLNAEIDDLNKKIVDTENQVKEIINFTQVSNGESAYLEYAFGAQTFTDFIYRFAIAEQLSEYNEKLIDEYNAMIRKNQDKQKELTNKQGELAEQQKSLKEKKESLGEKLENLDSVGVDINDAIEYQKEIIKVYEDKGCKDNEDIKTCGKKTLPPGTAFYRPTEYGKVTSEWGYRTLFGRSWHEGIDVGVKVGTTVYSVANGMVAMVVRYNCGGNMVVVHHNINGRTYTSVYAHLSSVSVSKGQTVNKNTIVGYSGGAAGGYDRCTTGPHLHLTIATGLYGVDYYDWLNQLNVQYSINPRSVINFPDGLYNSWEDRLTAY